MNSFLYFLIFAVALFGLFVYVVYNKVGAAVGDTAFARRLYARDMALLVDSMHAADGNFTIAYEMPWDFDFGLTDEKIIITEHSDKPLEKRAQTSFLFGRNEYVDVKPVWINRSIIMYTFKLKNDTIYIHVPSEDVVLPEP